MRLSPKTSIFLALLTVASAALLWFAPDSAPTGTSRPRVAATIFPLYDIARNVAGDAVDVTLVLPPGAEPHSFEPSPSTVRELNDAAAVYAIGHGIDGWIDPVLSATSSKVTVDRGIALRESVEPVVLGDDEHADEDEHGPIDPHYWLSAQNAIIIAETVADDLSARFPRDAEYFRANYRDYSDRLRALELEMRATIPAGKAIVTFHDAWGYFADAYGLVIAGTFEPSAGREPTARGLSALRAVIDRSGATTLFAEPLFSDDAVESFASDNGLSIGTLDDIGGTPGKESYIDLMRANAQAIAQAR